MRRITLIAVVATAVMIIAGAIAEEVIPNAPPVRSSNAFYDLPCEYHRERC